MDPRQYFIAFLESLDRVQPELRDRQTDRSRTLEIARMSISGDRAAVTMREPSGATEDFEWVPESGGWRVVASGVGRGIEWK